MPDGDVVEVFQVVPAGCPVGAGLDVVGEGGGEIGTGVLSEDYHAFLTGMRMCGAMTGGGTLYGSRSGYPSEVISGVWPVGRR